MTIRFCKTATAIALASCCICATAVLAQSESAEDGPVMVGVPPSAESQVTFGNYRTFPFNKWSFRNAATVMFAQMVPRGGDTADFTDAPDDSIGRMKVTDAWGNERTVDAILADNYTDGLLVLKDRRVVFERYYNGNDRDHQHIWFSATKSLTSSVAGILIAQGKIDLDASPADYIPELKGSGFERVTIQNVLNHSSSIDFKENYTDPDSDFLKYYGPALGLGYVPGARDAQPGETEIYGVHDFLSKFVRPEAAETPGDVFDYNSANSDVLGWVIARVSGMPYAEFVWRNLWSRIGAEHDAYVIVDRALQGVATGGMNTTLRDAARFGAMILNRGAWNGHQIIPADWVDASLHLTARDKAKMDANQRYKDAPYVAYKNMWWILDDTSGEYMAVGVHGQVVYVNRDAGVVISMFSSQPQASAANNKPFWSKINAVRAIAASLKDH